MRWLYLSELPKIQSQKIGKTFHRGREWQNQRTVIIEVSATCSSVKSGKYCTDDFFIFIGFFLILLQNVPFMVVIFTFRLSLCECVFIFLFKTTA